MAASFATFILLSAIICILLLCPQQINGWELDSENKINQTQIKAAKLIEIGCAGLKCYYTSESLDGIRFLDAIEYCQKNNLFPGVVETEEQNLAVLSGIGSGGPFWLPATDIGSEWTFRWIRTGRPVSFSDWIDNHPIVGPENQDVDYNCAYIYPSGSGTWLNLPCFTKFRPLCEFP